MGQLTTRTPSARGDWARSPVLWLLLLFLVSVPAITPRIYASDEIQYFAFLRSLWFDRDLSFENEYRYFSDRDIARSFGFRETFLERHTEAGRRINFGTIGCALLWAPAYALADLWVTMGGSPRRDGYSQPYIAAVSYASAVYGLLAVVLSAVAAHRIVGQGALAAFCVWVGTPLLFYMYIAPPMAHACSAFIVAVFVVTWLIVRERWSVRGMVTLGAVAGLMAMVREQDGFYVVGPMLDFGWTIVTTRREQGNRAPTRVHQNVRGAAFAILALLVVYLPQAYAYWSLNGRLGPSKLVTRKMNWASPHILDVLFSPAHGFFFWTPLAILGIVGLLLMLRREYGFRLGVCLVAMVLLQLYIAGSVESWTVAGAFGQRRFVGLTVILTIGLAALLRERPAPRFVLAALLVLCVWWNIGLIAQFGSGMMSRQRLEPLRNGYNNFVVLPKALPQLVYRYLVDRESFYRRPVGDDGGNGISSPPIAEQIKP